MPDIASIGQGGVGPLARPDAAAPATDAAARLADASTANARPGDRVELSDHARLLDRLRSLPAVREDLVDEVRTAIADDSYLTDEKLDIAIERLLEDLAG